MWSHQPWLTDNNCILLSSYRYNSSMTLLLKHLLHSILFRISFQIQHSPPPATFLTLNVCHVSTSIRSLRFMNILSYLKTCEMLPYAKIASGPTYRRPSWTGTHWKPGEAWSHRPDWPDGNPVWSQSPAVDRSHPPGCNSPPGLLPAIIAPPWWLWNGPVAEPHSLADRPDTVGYVGGT